MNLKGHKGTLKGPGGQRCKDGYVSIVAGPVPVVPIAATFEAVKEMMIAEGKAPDWWLAEDWYAKFFEIQETGNQELVDRQWEPIEKFLLTKTKAELYDAALKNRLLLAPAQTVQEIQEDPQLKARAYWVTVEHPELDDKITYCGPPVKMSQAPWRIHRRSPLIGEHTREIFKDLEAITKKESLTRIYPESSIQQKTDKMLQACEGVKILDFGWAATGPMSVRYLADYGAEVIHVQSFSRPCFLSYQRPRKNDIAHPDYGYWAAMYNASKYSVTLNLDKPGAIRLIYELIEKWQPDVIAECFTPGIMKKYDLDYDATKQIKPDVIYFSTCIQGQYGPRSYYPGYGNLGANLAGFYYISGYPDRDISPPYGAYTDFINMRYGATHLLTALEYRRRTGKGMYIDMSQYEVGLHFMAPPLMDFMVNGRIFERNGNRLPHAAPHGVYPCKGEDRWVAIGVFNDANWNSFRNALGNPDWCDSPKFSTFFNRKKNEDELDELITQWSINYTPKQAETMMQDAGVSAHVANSVKELFEDPQLEHRNHFRVFEHSVMGPTRFEGLPLKLSKTPDRMWCPAAYGEHNMYVFKDILNLTDDQISDLIVAGVISKEADYFDMVDRMLGQKE
jgi:crotonobetainyl-CoA:carnitine CoA-transferase CaiB-like acyl-CoA transferase